MGTTSENGGRSASFSAADSESRINASANRNKSTEDYLRSIDAKLEELLKNGRGTSQSNARSSESNSRFRNNYKQSGNGDKSGGKSSGGVGNIFGKSLSGMFDDFLDSFEEQMFDALIGSKLKEGINSIFQEMVDVTGLELRDIPGVIGKELGNQAANAVKNSPLGKKIFDGLGGAVDKLFGNAKNKFRQNVDEYAAENGTTSDEIRRQAAEQAAERARTRSQSDARAEDAREDFGSSSSNIFDAAQNAADVASDLAGKGGKGGGFANAAQNGIGGATQAGQAAGQTSSTIMNVANGAKGASAGANGIGALMKGISGLTKMAGKAIPWLAAIMVVLEILSPVLEALGDIFKAFGAAANRAQKSEEKKRENAQKRLEQDYKTLIEQPFKILKDAAQSVYEAWDKSLNTITATQGYTKADVQTLASTYAQRLRDEGLSSVVSGADMLTNLENVLKGGLQGAVADEFAYLATVLNAAIPTQDFFQYADSYAAVAANAMSQGMSQTEAIAEANEQLEIFASNVLYAGRQLTGGFASGLTDAKSLFDAAVKIAQTSKTGDVGQISGVITSVSAAVGAIAPDLASSITDAVIDAAIGGNSSNLVALRSLTGTNASNTEFLRQLANDPQGLFVSMFKGLGSIQNISGEAWMERAEALSETFGISAEALNRVDFNYLAEQIARMEVSTAAISENMDMLISGETTLSDEQMKMQQINKYLLDEGLSYVLDNEAGRAIQDHMWEEQLANQMMEAEYSVQLTGTVEQAVLKIMNFVESIVNLLNPFAWFNKLSDMVHTAVEGAAMEADVRQVLELGKVGNGNFTALYQLTTREIEHDLIDPLVNLMGGQSLYDAAKTSREAFGYANSPFNLSNIALKTKSAVSAMAALGSVSLQNMSDSSSGVSSKYQWGDVGKSSAVVNYLKANAQTSTSSGSGAKLVKSEEASAQEAALNKLEGWLAEEHMSQFTQEKGGYEKWWASASEFGVSGDDNLKKAIEEAGYTEDQIRQRFTQQQAQENSEFEYWLKREQFKYYKIFTEEEWHIKFKDWLANEFNEEEVGIKPRLGSIQTEIENFHADVKSFIDRRSMYSYNADTPGSLLYSPEDVSKVKIAEGEAGSAEAYALAEGLVTAIENMYQQDPAIKTNVLLSQILLVVRALYQLKNNNGGLGNEFDLGESLVEFATGGGLLGSILSGIQNLLNK